ncbi:MAG TPA: hypothetical protein VFL80_10895 [Thermoanaerobaculia bacterium]|nr:hypothetical protein [Thermoanaerobaculia bacterium]
MQVRRAYWIRFFAGATFGLYVTHLLYFLNPQIDVTRTRLAMDTLVYGTICGAIFGSLLWALRAIRLRIMGDAPGPEHARGFGFIVMAAFAAATVYWFHLATVRQYLPIGAVRMLSIGANVVSATAFLLLILWTIERNAKKGVSRTILTLGLLLIALSSVALYQRRGRYRDARRTAVVANAGTLAEQQPVVMVAIRNLPYDWIVTVSGEGGLSFFDGATRSGYFTRLEPFPTTSPKALWASLITGKLPYGHGVTGRFSYRTALSSRDPDERYLLLPNGVGFRAWGLLPPVKRISANLPSGEALSLWSLFERLGLRAAVINWPGSKSATASLIVSDDAIRSASLRHPDASRVGERFRGTGEAQQRIVHALLADGTAIGGLTRASASTPFDLRVAALEGFEEAQRAVHIFRNEIPPADSLKGITARAYLRELDRLLASVSIAFPNHLLVVVSPNAPVARRPPATPLSLLQDAISEADRSSDDGFLLMTGPGVRSAARPSPVAVTDVVPTVLFAVGLPVARDMDGRVVSEAFDEQFLRQRPLSLIPTYEAQRLVVRRPGRMGVVRNAAGQAGRS